MITISRLLARQVYTVARRALGLTSRGLSPPVLFLSGPDGLRIRTMNTTAAVEYHVAGSFPREQLIAPFELLAPCEGGRADPVTLEAQNKTISARWSHRGEPRSGEFDVPDHPVLPFPEVPARMAENPPGLLVALLDAMQTADRAGSRYPIHAVQLRGGKGTIAATDSRQLLLQSGFRFDWEGDVLVPRNKVLEAGELSSDQPVFAGCNEHWFSLTTGPWTLHLALLKEGRFPRVEDVIQSPRGAIATVRFGSADAEFLARSLDQLPGPEGDSSPVTLDLNGMIAVRAKENEQPRPTELVLSASERTGRDVRLSTNRRYLERALRLGFRELLVFGPEAPLQCRDRNRCYVWAALADEGTVPPSSDAIQIASPTPASAVPEPHPDPPPERRRSRMPRTTSPTEVRPDRPLDDNEAQPADDLYAQAELVRNALREALNGMNALLAGLRTHRKQDRLVRSTLQTLRQLKALDA